MSTVPNFPNDFDLTSARGGSRGARLAESRSGQWWWCSAAGEPGVVCGLQGVDATVGTEAADHQAKTWGFNLLLPPTAPAFRRKGAAHVTDLALDRAGPRTVREEGVSLPDVFDSTWPEAVEQRINGTEPVAGLVGWQCAAEWRWGGWAEVGQPLPRAGLLQVCLGLDPAFRAYHSAWDFVLARHGGELAKVAAAWGMELPGRGAVRQLTRDEQLIDSPGYRHDLTDFILEYALRYFSPVRTAAREINPDCLLLSPLLDRSTPPAVREVAASHCDLLPVDAPGLVAANAPQLWQVSGWPEAAGGTDPATGEGAYERRIRVGRETVVAGLRDPRIVGYAWARFRGGDLMADDPFGVGLVDDNGRRNECLVQSVTAINAVATRLRLGATAGGAA